MKRFAIAALMSAVVTAAASLPGDDARPRPLAILFTGMVKGTFGPCGCKENPNGGLSRRAGYAAQKSEAVVLHVDLGNYFEDPGPQAAQINELMREGIRKLPVRVLNLAPDDLFHWEEIAASDLGAAQVISTNLVPRDPSAPKPAHYAIVRIPAEELGTQKDLRIGFLGLSDPARIKPNSNFRGLDPAAAVAEAKKELAGRADFLVVLADIQRPAGPLSPQSVLAQIARENPEVYAILHTDARYRLRPAEQVNNAVILSSVERGRHLGQLTLKFSADGVVEGAEADFIDLKEGTPEDPELLRAQLELEARMP